MQVEFYVFLNQFIILCTQYNFVNLKPLVGNNINLAEYNEFSFIVSIMQIKLENPDPIRDHICAGSMISRKDILTSQHCVSLENPDGIKVIIGSNNLYEGDSYYIFWWLMYDQWAIAKEIEIEFLENDVAIIRLLQLIPSNIQLAGISALHNFDLYGRTVVTAGWGSENNTVANYLLQYVTLRVISSNECERRILPLLGFESYVEERQAICTINDPYALLSRGDSGGPLLTENKIVAINRGICPEIALGDPNVVNYHIGIDYYRQFILELKYFTTT